MYTKSCVPSTSEKSARLKDRPACSDLETRRKHFLGRSMNLSSICCNFEVDREFSWPRSRALVTHLSPRERIESRGEVSKGFTARVLHKPVHLTLLLAAKNEPGELPLLRPAFVFRTRLELISTNCRLLYERGFALRQIQRTCLAFFLIPQH